MSERSIVITEKDGTYQIHSSLLNEFELLGLFEQIVFDLKHSKSNKDVKQTTVEPAAPAEPAPIAKETSAPVEIKSPVEKAHEPKETVPRIPGVTTAQASDLRVRIGNAVKAIRDLDGKVESVDLSRMSDEELQVELGELTDQYKRLKKSKGSK